MLIVRVTIGKFNFGLHSLEDNHLIPRYRDDLAKIVQENAIESLDLNMDSDQLLNTVNEDVSENMEMDIQLKKNYS
jgi:hypothetical protein